MRGESPLNLENRLDLDVWTVPALLQRRAQLSGTAPALWSLSTDGVWYSTHWIEYCDMVGRIANDLSEWGLMPGDRVGIIAPSSRNWDLMQMGILTARGVVVGLDPHDRKENLNAVARHCGLSGMVVHDPSWLGWFDADIRAQWRFVVSLRPTEEGGVIAFDRFSQGLGSELKFLWSAVQPDDPATIIFTSGTTGASRGIQYTHRQLCLAVSAILGEFTDIDVDSRLVCWLPLSNLFQRMINICAIGCGAQTYYIEDPRTLMHHVGSIEPHLLIGVPRFYEKLHVGIMDRIDQGPVWQRRLVEWALDVGKDYTDAVRTGLKPKWLEHRRYMLADRLVLHRMRSILGSRLRYLVSGSAPMPQWLLERFHAMGLLILEAYGMSENIIPIAMNRPQAYRFGTVGRPLPGNEFYLAEDSELWVRGPGVFGGYYNSRDGEENRFDANGYLATGDYVAVDTDNFITLTGRKSEIFKTSTGRRIAPAGIEGILRQASCVEHAVVLGASRPFLVAVLVITEAAFQSWRGENAGCSALSSLCDYLRREIAPQLVSLADYQRPAGAVVTTRGFSVESGELTPNLKLRRTNIQTTYQVMIEELYSLLEAADGVAVQVERDEGRVILCSL